MTPLGHAPRVAVVGAAGWAGSRHARALAAAVAKVTILVEKDDRGFDLAQELDAQLVASPAELHPEDLDLVVVALPTTIQPGICADLLNRGFRVLTEKPVAPDAEGGAVLAAASGVNERLMVGYTLHQHPAASLVAQWVKSQDVIAVAIRSAAHKQSINSWRADPKVLATSTSSSMYGSPVSEHVISTLDFPEGVVVTLQSYWCPWQEPQGLNQGDWSLTIDVLATDCRMLCRSLSPKHSVLQKSPMRSWQRHHSGPRAWVAPSHHRKPNPHPTVD
ncbi:Gfo/Idh/MocA family oxidoreductase [Arthrobacter sp. NPDC080073]|uniref:Gfo/Idh/MocA family protein n=1 Tax=Arthrobacter sp. NPDC080073 TaxID=3155919 RepID=UPI00343A23A1